VAKLVREGAVFATQVLTKKDRGTGGSRLLPASRLGPSGLPTPGSDGMEKGIGGIVCLDEPWCLYDVISANNSDGRISASPWSATVCHSQAARDHSLSVEENSNTTLSLCA
jgi:hypothetical protein